VPGNESTAGGLAYAESMTYPPRGPAGPGIPPPDPNSPPPPPGYSYPPPGHGNQGYPPPGQGYPPPGQGFPPPGQGFPPPGQGYRPPPPRSSKGLVIGLLIGGLVLVGSLVAVATVGLIIYNRDGASRHASPATTQWQTATRTPWSATNTPWTTTTTPAASTLYGAFAVSTATGDVGWAINSSTQSGAESLARSKCGASSCAGVLWFRNACGALAQSQNDSSWGWAWSTTRQEAITKAFGYVTGGNPKVIVAKCTSNVTG